MRKFFQPVGNFGDFLLVNGKLCNSRDSLEIYHQRELRNDMPSSTSNANFRLSFLGVRLATSSMPSKLSTVCRFDHAEITESDSFGTNFGFFDAVAVLVATVLGFFIVFAFLFRGFKSSSSESTRRGIALTRRPHHYKTHSRFERLSITWHPEVTRDNSSSSTKDCNSILLIQLYISISNL